MHSSVYSDKPSSLLSGNERKGLISNKKRKTNSLKRFKDE